MTKTPPEEEIQKVIKMLEESNPEQATRDNAIKVIDKMRKMAGTVVDRIDEDLKTSKIEISENGEVQRSDTADCED